MTLDYLPHRLFSNIDILIRTVDRVRLWKETGFLIPLWDLVLVPCFITRSFSAIELLLTSIDWDLVL